MTLLSRILGFVRDFFIARVFGACLATDAFFVALRIPNLMRRLFAEGAFSQAFVAGVVFCADRCDPPVLVLAWAVFIGGLLQLALQLPFLWKIGMLPRWSFDLRHPGVRRVLKLMGPAVFGVSVSQVSLLINTIFASFLVTGSVSWLYYADRLMEFPAGVLGAALGTILLPSLSKHHAGGASAEYSKLLDWGLRVTLLLAMPAAAALAVLAMPLIATLFHYGRFSAEDAWMTREALVAYSLGLVGMILVKILAPGFYAKQNVVTPVKIGLVTLAVTQAMNLAFIGPLKHAGLALAIGLGACLNAYLLFVFLRRQQIYSPQPGWLVFALKVGLSVIVMAAALVFAMGSNAVWLAAGWQWKTGMLAGLVLLGFAVYGACLLGLGFRPRHFSIRG